MIGSIHKVFYRKNIKVRAWSWMGQGGSWVGHTWVTGWSHWVMVLMTQKILGHWLGHRNVGHEKNYPISIYIN